MKHTRKNKTRRARQRHRGGCKCCAWESMLRARREKRQKFHAGPPEES